MFFYNLFLQVMNCILRDKKDETGSKKNADEIELSSTIQSLMKINKSTSRSKMIIKPSTIKMIIKPSTIQSIYLMHSFLLCLTSYDLMHEYHKLMVLLVNFFITCHQQKPVQTLLV